MRDCYKSQVAQNNLFLFQLSKKRKFHTFAVNEPKLKINSNFIVFARKFTAKSKKQVNDGAREGRRNFQREKPSE